MGCRQSNQCLESSGCDCKLWLLVCVGLAGIPMPCLEPHSHVHIPISDLLLSLSAENWRLALDLA